MNTNAKPNKYTFNRADKKHSRGISGSGIDFENIV